MELRIEEHATRLQATRGIAALCVTVGHCLTTFTNGHRTDPAFRMSSGNFPLALGELVVQQNAAVIFFYVLSGLVLGESLRRRPGFATFAVRRILRLLPVMWTSILFALALLPATAARPFPGASRWFDAFFERSIGLGEICTDLAGLNWNVNSVLWSVQIELVMIAALPALLCLVERLPLCGNLVLWAVLAASSPLIWGQLPGWANATLYLYCFHAGLIMPSLLRERRVRALFGQRLVCVMALLVLLTTQLLYVTNRLWLPYKFIADTLVSVQLLGFLMSRPAARELRLLDGRPFVWLGDVSYSFYAFSMPIQLVLASWLLSALDGPPGDAAATALTFGITLGTVSCALLLAGLSYRWLELPCIAAGRHWSREMELRQPILPLVRKFLER